MQTRKYLHRREAEGRMKLGPKQEQGFTLIEVLAAIVILSIVSLVLTSYFTNAMSYSKSNQNKTIMVNLARNALFYVEKQDFEPIKEYFRDNKNSGIFSDQCYRPETEPGFESCQIYSNIADTGVLADVLNPTINGIQYHIDISYQKALDEVALDSADPIQLVMAKYLLPVKVRVRDSGRKNNNISETVVEGYITDEEIR